MNCQDTHELLYVYLDRETTRFRRWRIRRHLHRCPPCENGFVFEEHLKGRIRRGCQEQVSRELLDRLRASLHQTDTGTEA